MSVHELRLPYDAAPPSALERESAAQMQARGVLTERLVAEFPSIPRPRVGALIDEAYRRTGDARIQAFRVLLAERDARAALRAELEA